MNANSEDIKNLFFVKVKNVIYFATAPPLKKIGYELFLAQIDAQKQNIHHSHMLSVRGDKE